MSENGGPAFPGVSLDLEVLKALRKTPANFSAQDAVKIASYRAGMTLRDYFAGKALGHALKEYGGDAQAAASMAYRIADAMIEGRKEES